MLEAIKNYISLLVDGIEDLVGGIATIVRYFVSLFEDIAWISGYIGNLLLSGFKDWFFPLPDLVASIV